MSSADNVGLGGEDRSVHQCRCRDHESEGVRSHISVLQGFTLLTVSSQDMGSVSCYKSKFSPHHT